jgi:hypothetical protein
MSVGGEFTGTDGHPLMLPLREVVDKVGTTRLLFTAEIYSRITQRQVASQRNQTTQGTRDIFAIMLDVDRAAETKVFPPKWKPGVLTATQLAEQHALYYPAREAYRQDPRKQEEERLRLRTSALLAFPGNGKENTVPVQAIVAMRFSSSSQVVANTRAVGAAAGAHPVPSKAMGVVQCTLCLKWRAIPIADTVKWHATVFVCSSTNWNTTHNTCGVEQAADLIEEDDIEAASEEDEAEEDEAEEEEADGAEKCAWAQCDVCSKWRKLALGAHGFDGRFTCSMSAGWNTNYANCDAEEEKEEDGNDGDGTNNRAVDFVTYEKMRTSIDIVNGMRPPAEQHFRRFCTSAGAPLAIISAQGFARCYSTELLLVQGPEDAMSFTPVADSSGKKQMSYVALILAAIDAGGDGLKSQHVLALVMRDWHHFPGLGGLLALVAIYCVGYEQLRGHVDGQMNTEESALAVAAATAFPLANAALAKQVSPPRFKHLVIADVWDEAWDRVKDCDPALRYVTAQMLIDIIGRKYIGPPVVSNGTFRAYVKRDDRKMKASDNQFGCYVDIAYAPNRTLV